jgi:hypothetical protein
MTGYGGTFLTDGDSTLNRVSQIASGGGAGIGHCCCGPARAGIECAVISASG